MFFLFYVYVSPFWHLLAKNIHLTSINALFHLPYLKSHLEQISEILFVVELYMHRFAPEPLVSSLHVDEVYVRRRYIFDHIRLKKLPIHQVMTQKVEIMT